MRFYNIFRTIFSSKGFTLIELMIVTAIFSTLAAISVPTFTSYLDKTRVTRAIVDIRVIEKDITAYWIHFERYPDNLSQVDRGGFLDPWGTPYQYQYLIDKKGKIAVGLARKDRFLVPLNSEFDLYSMGRDKDSKGPLVVPVSHDDVIRASDGAYVGLASRF